jgi:hypothetical protein
MSLPETLVPIGAEKRLPAAVGILIAMGTSVALWGAI